MTTVVRFLQGDGPGMTRARLKALRTLKQEIMTHRSDLFPLVVSAPDLRTALETTIQAFGIGPIHANTVLLNWMKADKETKPHEQHHVSRYGETLRVISKMGCHIVVLHARNAPWTALSELKPEARRIDVWWQGDATSRLMLLMAYLVTRDAQWDGASIQVLALNYSEDSDDNMKELTDLIEAARIEAIARIVIAPADEKLSAMIPQNSHDAALTFVPFKLKNGIPVDPMGNPLNDLLTGLGITALALAGRSVDLDAEPEEGEAGTLAQAVDLLEQANKRAAIAEKTARDAADRAARKMDEITLSGGPLDENLAKKLKSALKARNEADAAAQKAIKEQVKSADAAKKCPGFRLSRRS